MGLLSVLALAFAPGAFWLWSIQRRDRSRPDQKSMLIRVFFFGVAIALPVVLVEWALGGGREDTQWANLRVAFYEAFIVAGVVEEVGKWLVVRSTIYTSPYFDEPLAGLVYASAAALGFASIENLGYMMRFGAGVIVVRSFFSTLAHVIFSSLWGYALGWSRLGSSAGRSRLVRALPLAAGLVAAIALHGAFDFFLMAYGSKGTTISALLFSGGALVFLFLLRRAARTSPHRASVAPRVRLCPGCLTANVTSATSCGACGLHLPLALRVGFSCGKCKRPVDAETRYCRTCGSRLVEARPMVG